MTDKENFRAKIAKAYNEAQNRVKLVKDEYWEGKVDAYRNVLCIFDSMQEEPTTSVWHNITEEPKMGKWILFRHSKGWYHVGRKSKGRFNSGWFSDGCSAFPLSEFVEWAYIDDILKL